MKFIFFKMDILQIFKEFFMMCWDIEKYNEYLMKETKRLIPPEVFIKNNQRESK